MKMNDPYEKLFESISKALIKLSKMIVWIAKRALSVKDFEDFIDAFPEEGDEHEKTMAGER